MPSYDQTHDEYLWSWMQAIQPPAQAMPPTLVKPFDDYPSNIPYDSNQNPVQPLPAQHTSHQWSSHPDEAPPAQGQAYPPGTQGSPFQILHKRYEEGDQVMYSNRSSDEGSCSLFAEGVDDDDDRSDTPMSVCAPTEIEQSHYWKDDCTEYWHWGEGDDWLHSQGVGGDAANNNFAGIRAPSRFNSPMSDIQYSNQEEEGPSIPRIYSPHVHVNRDLSSPRIDGAFLHHASHSPDVSGTISTMAHTRHSSGPSGPMRYQGLTQAATHEELDGVGSSLVGDQVKETEQKTESSPAVASTGHSVFSVVRSHVLHVHGDREDQIVAACPRLPSRHTKDSSSELDSVPVPCIEVDDNEDGYVFERPNRSRRQRDLDEEETEHRPSKRVRLQTPDDLETSSRSKSSSDLHIKYSCGRRTRGSTRYN